MDPQLGVVAYVLTLVAVVVGGSWLVRRYMRSVRQSILLSQALPPLRIHLQADPSESDPSEPDATDAPPDPSKALEALGFSSAGVWRVPELGGLRIHGFILDDPCLLATVMFHPVVGPLVDLLALGPDGEVITVSSSTEGTGLDAPPFKTSVHRPGAEPAELLTTMQAELAQRGWEVVEPGAFSIAYARLWAREMDWRYARGGATLEELRLVAEARGVSPDPHTLERAQRIMQAQASQALDDLTATPTPHDPAPTLPPPRPTPG